MVMTGQTLPLADEGACCLPDDIDQQLQANRLNALKSTGPRSEAGKQRSRYNALRHGLTAETVIAALEHKDDYQAFAAKIAADYLPPVGGRD